MTYENKLRLTREALEFAIERLAAEEKQRGYTSESCQLAAWRQLLKEMTSVSPGLLAPSEARGSMDRE